MEDSLLKFLGSDSGFGAHNNSAYIEERDKLKDYTNKLNICKEQYEDILKKITD